jgi:glycine/D-amino acid oxidase-like deaminating enzyme
MTAFPDALVIGGGVVGAAVACFLSREGLSVEVLEAAFSGGGTTAGGMGHIVVMDDSEAQFALTSYSRRLLAELQPDCEWDACGTLWVAESAEQLPDIAAKQEYYRARGVHTEILDERGLAEAEPNLRTPLPGALRVPHDGVVYPVALARWLLRQAVENGASVREDTRVERIADNAVIVDGKRLEAEVIVNAAGAAAPQLTPGLPIAPRKGHLVITDRYPGFCRHQIVELGYLASAHGAHAASGESVAFNVQPRRTGQVLIGSSRERVGFDARVNRSLLSRMLARATSFMPALAALNAIRVWTAFRPATPDNLPFIGRWEETPGLWIAAGHEGLGITTSLGTGRLLADLIAGREPAIDAAPYSPARLGISV